jgi:hypothetical protein
MLKKNADKSFEAVEIASPNGDRTQIKGKRSAGRLIMAELAAFGDALLRLFLRVVRIAAATTASPGLRAKRSSKRTPYASDAR